MYCNHLIWLNKKRRNGTYRIYYKKKSRITRFNKQMNGRMDLLFISNLMRLPYKLKQFEWVPMRK